MKLREIVISETRLGFQLELEGEIEANLLKYIVGAAHPDLLFRIDKPRPYDAPEPLKIIKSPHEPSADKPVSGRTKKRVRYQIDNDELSIAATEMLDEVQTMEELYNKLAEEYNCPVGVIKGRLYQMRFDHGGRFRRGRRRDQSGAEGA